jgi:hypothetical protein
MGCPILAWKDDSNVVADVLDTSKLIASSVVFSEDVVVMTQACDLQNDKVDNVVLCPHIGLADYRWLWQEEMKTVWQNPTEKAWKSHFEDLTNGYLWNLAALSAGEVDPLVVDIRVVDFHEIYTLPRVFLESFLQERGKPRLRLLPPYREHLSQAFARFFMRVGLPTAVTGER